MDKGLGRTGVELVTSRELRWAGQEVRFGPGEVLDWRRHFWVVG